MPFGLVVLSAVPVAVGVVRLVQFADGADVTSTTARYLSSWVPLLLHIVSNIGFVLRGALQAAFGKSALSHALLSGAGWVINLAVAQWSIVRHGGGSLRAARPQPVIASSPARRGLPLT